MIEKVGGNSGARSWNYLQHRHRKASNYCLYKGCKPRGCPGSSHGQNS